MVADQEVSRTRISQWTNAHIFSMRFTGVEECLGDFCNEVKTSLKNAPEVDESFVWMAWKDLVLENLVDASYDRLADAFFKVYCGTNLNIRAAAQKHEKELIEGPWKTLRLLSRSRQRRTEMRDECIGRLSNLLRNGFRQDNSEKILLCRNKYHVTLVIPNATVNRKRTALHLEFSLSGYSCVQYDEEELKKVLQINKPTKEMQYSGDIDHLLKSLRVLRCLAFSSDHYHTANWNCQDFVKIVLRAMQQVENESKQTDELFEKSTRFERMMCKSPPVKLFGGATRLYKKKFPAREVATRNCNLLMAVEKTSRRVEFEKV